MCVVIFFFFLKTYKNKLTVILDRNEKGNFKQK